VTSPQILETLVQMLSVERGWFFTHQFATLVSDEFGVRRPPEQWCERVLSGAAFIEKGAVWNVWHYRPERPSPAPSKLGVKYGVEQRRAAR
jgi:hypothetical protein